MNYLFTTKRLQVRQLKMEDLATLHKMHSNAKVMIYTGSEPQTLAQDQENLKHIISSYNRIDNVFWVWGVERKSDQKLIGTCALLKTKTDNPEDEIGYRFSEEHWGNGYAFETAQGLIPYVFSHFKKEYLVAETDELNLASVKILEKLMTFIKTEFNPRFQSNDRIYRIDQTAYLEPND